MFLLFYRCIWDATTPTYCTNPCCLPEQLIKVISRLPDNFSASSRVARLVAGNAAAPWELNCNDLEQHRCKKTGIRYSSTSSVYFVIYHAQRVPAVTDLLSQAGKKGLYFVFIGTFVSIYPLSSNLPPPPMPTPCKIGHAGSTSMESPLQSQDKQW